MSHSGNENNEMYSRVTIFQYEKLTGYDTYIFDFTRVLSKSGHSITVVTSDQMPLIGGTRIVSENELSDHLAGSRWIELKFIKIFPSPSSLRLLRKILASSSVVYVKNEVLDLIPILLAKRHMSTAVVCGVHTALHYFDWKSLRARLHNIIYHSFIYGRLLSACDIIHVLNADDKIFLERILNIDPSKISMVPLWADHEEPKLLIRKEVNRLFKILYLGGLDMRKGIDVLLQSITRISKEAPEKFGRMSFTIVGNGPFVGHVKKAQDNYNNVHYSSFVTGRRIDLYNQNDVMIVPSRGETFSYVTLEALSCGLPVIASNIPGPRSIIEDQRTGVLFPVGDSPALAKAILSMYDFWSQDCRYHNMRILCRQRVLRHFSFNSIRNNFGNLFRRAVSMKLSCNGG